MTFHASYNVKFLTREPITQGTLHPRLLSATETDHASLTQTCDFAWYNAGWTLLAILFYAINAGSDIWVCSQYYRAGAIDLFVYSVVVLVTSFLILSLVNLVWIFQDMSSYGAKKSNRTLCRPPLSYYVFLFVSSFLLISVPARYAIAFYYGCEVLQAKRAAKSLRVRLDQQQCAPHGCSCAVKPCSFFVYCRILEEDRDAALLRLLESFMRTVPQILIQSYAVLNMAIHHRTDWSAVFHYCSLTLSLMSLAWVLVSQHRCLRFSRMDKNNMTIGGSILMFLWRFFLILARFTVIGFVIVAFSWGVVIIFLIRFGTMLIWIIATQSFRFCPYQALDGGFQCVLAWIHLFVPFNTVEGATRARYLFYFVYDVVESMILVGFVQTYNRLPAVVRGYMGMAVIGFYSLGLTTFLLYYKWFHPNRVADRWRPQPPGIVIDPPAGSIKDSPTMTAGYHNHNQSHLNNGCDDSITSFF